MTTDDIEDARVVQAAAFAGPDDPTDPTTFPPEVTARQHRRYRQLLAEDPAGCWVADDGDRAVGVALALLRDDLWGLSLLAVRPDLQAKGIGRRLLEASLTYAAGADRSVILSTSDPKAIACYAGAGFDLHPQVAARGKVRRTPPADPRVRAGGQDDLALADEVDRAVRRAARYGDQLVLAEMWSMYVVDDSTGRGYAYVRENGEVEAVAATSDEIATALLWRCLEHAVAKDVEASVEHMTREQQWAVRVAIEAGLSLRPSGPVFWRGDVPPASYLPSGPWL
ncbi:MAG TPA: GNAT family N-acetyltransferase [Mycobacteriales bacterium]|nr:GNAT family N-acetyltransferase [Mycobacteriales bacterium]